MTPKQAKTKLRAVQDKFRQSKLDKIQFGGSVTSVQSLWSVPSVGNTAFTGLLRCSFAFIKT